MGMTPNPKTAKEWAEDAAKELAMDSAHIPLIGQIIESRIEQAMAQARTEALEEAAKELALVPMLIAQNARLRKALRKEAALSRPPTDLAIEVLAETPSKALGEFVAQVEDEALEKAAKECQEVIDHFGDILGVGLARDRIRALKSKPEKGQT